jgi:hypothetical protein
LIGGVFFISFEKGLKIKESQSGKNVFVCVFFNIKENGLENKLD